MSESDLPDYVKVNRDHWTKNNAAYTDGHAEDAWNEREISWGVWHTPEAEVKVLPDVLGKDVVELGCGTAYVAAWLKRRGARRVVGVDITPAQLDTARRLNTKYGLGLELIEANAEATGLPGASFDLAISEYGASIWCDPYKWIPEAARLLRSDGELVFLRNSTLSMLCMPDHGKVQERLQRPQLGMNRMDWPDELETEFQLGHGDLIRLLRKSGFEILNMVEFFAPADAVNHPFYGEYMSVEWAQKWPSEEMWHARKARLDGGLVRASGSRRNADHARTAGAGRLATGRSKGRDLGDQMTAQANLTAELIRNADPCPLLDDRGSAERDPALGQPDSPTATQHRNAGYTMPDRPVLDETEADP